jgi:tetratricopeptide (TPR) repeat protein
MRAPMIQFHPAAAAFGAAMLSILLTATPLSAQSPEEMDSLFSELSSSQGDAWMRAQSDIERIWSRSGSAALDLLLIRGEAALDAGDVEGAIGHLTALTENAPDFTAGWAARATAFYLAGQTGPAMADLAQALRLEPRQWHSATLLGNILEDMGNDEAALAAYGESLAINPHQEEARDGIARLLSAGQGQDA